MEQTGVFRLLAVHEAGNLVHVLKAGTVDVGEKKGCKQERVKVDKDAKQRRGVHIEHGLASDKQIQQQYYEHTQQ